MNELAGSHLANESIMLSQDDKSTEKAFAVKSESSCMKKYGQLPVKEDTSFVRCSGRGVWRGRGYNRGRKRHSGQSQGLGEVKFSKSHIQCFNCKKYGHYNLECWFNEK